MCDLFVSGKRLPPGHPGRAFDESRVRWTNREKYHGKNFSLENEQFDHFYKSFQLDSVPAFPDRMKIYGSKSLTYGAGVSQNSNFEVW